MLIDFPFEIALGYYAGKWCAFFPPMRLWMWAFIGRLVAAVLAHITVWLFPQDGVVGTGYLMVVIAEHIFSTFTSTVMFVAVSAFHAQIADPKIGGTYMTLLATVSNLGGTFPRIFVLKLVDALTAATCAPAGAGAAAAAAAVAGGAGGAGKEGGVFDPFSCALEADKHRCRDVGGACVVYTDGYYLTNVVCVVVGAASFVWYIRPRVERLMVLPLRAWREYI